MTTQRGVTLPTGGTRGPVGSVSMEGTKYPELGKCAEWPTLEPGRGVLPSERKSQQQVLISASAWFSSTLKWGR